MMRERDERHAVGRVKRSATQQSAARRELLGRAPAEVWGLTQPTKKQRP